MGAQIRLGEGDGDGGVGRKIERWVPFSPIPERRILLARGGRGAGACPKKGGVGGGGTKKSLLDDGNVHGSRGACAINLGLSHLCVKFEEIVLTQSFFINCHEKSREPQRVEKRGRGGGERIRSYN